MNTNNNDRRKKFSTPVIGIAIGIALSQGATAQVHHVYRTAEYDSAQSVQLTSDKGYIVAGMTRGDGVSSQGLLLKTDAAGNIMWSNGYGGPRTEVLESVREVPSQPLIPSSYVAAGSTESFGYGGHDLYMIGANIAGNLTFSRSFGGERSDRGHCVQVTRNAKGMPDGYVAVGESDSFGSGSFDCYIVRTDLAGNLMASTTIGGKRNDTAAWIEQTRDGGFIVAGYTYSYPACISTQIDPSTQRDIYIVKLRSNLVVDWARSYGSLQDDAATCIRETREGGFIVTGTTSGFKAQQSDAFLLKLDPFGNVKWMNVYGGESRDLAHAVLAEPGLNGEEYTVSGSTASFAPGTSLNAWSFKTDSDGSVLQANLYGDKLADRGFELDHGFSGYAMIGDTTSFGALGNDIYFMEMSLAGESKCYQQRIDLKGFKAAPCEGRGAEQRFLQHQRINSDQPRPIPFKHLQCSSEFSSEPLTHARQ